MFAGLTSLANMDPEPSFRLELQIITSCDCRMASDRPAVSGGGRRGRNKADVTNGDPPTTTGGALGFIRELRGLFTKVEPLIHEFDALEKTQVDVGELRRQLEEKQQEMEKMKKGMQMEIDRNKMLADKHIGDRIESIKLSKSNEDTLGAELKKMHMQMEQLRTKHQEELSALETNLSDANLRQRSKGKEDMDQLKKEKEEALRKAQRYRRESERLTESLQIEKTRLELVKSNLEQTEEKLSSLGLEELDQTL